MTKIALALNDRANLRLLPVIEALHEHPDFDLHVICGGSMVLPRFDFPCQEVIGLDASHVHCELEGGTHYTMTRSIGLSVDGYAQEFARNRPDYLIVIGDRYETLGTAIAAHYQRIPIIHFQGGEVSGTLDNSTRWLITQMADYHVPATRQAAAALWDVILEQRGNPIADISDLVLAIGCPGIDLCYRIELPERRTGPPLVVYHPDTAKEQDAAEFAAILAAVPDGSDVFWPNIDPGSDAIWHQIRAQRDRFKTHVNMPPSDYLRLMANAACCVGNSSSFVRDAGALGVPVVLVGDRQKGREVDESVWFAGKHDVAEAMKQAITTGLWARSTLYGDGKTTQRFMAALEQLCRS